MQKISPFLWFDGQAEEAANYYTSIFRDSKILAVTRYGEAGAGASGIPAGTVMTVSFQIEGQEFTALNGGPHFKFTEAISFVVECKSQEEIDDYWRKLGSGGDPNAQQCGWLKDKYGVSWQIVPAVLAEMLQDKDSAKANKVIEALVKMKKLDIASLERAFQS